MPEVAVSNADRVVFPDGLTKGELVEYYTRVADHILPHLAGRPLTMQIAPKGVGAEGVTYIKERRKHFPDWVGSVSVPRQGKSDILMPVIGSADELRYVANQGMITPHVPLARIDAPDHPDRLVFDLDPSTDDLGVIKDTALALRTFLSDLGLVPYVKASGSRGLHVTVPLDRSATMEASREFAEWVAAELAAAHPDDLTTEFSKADRGSRLFLDVLRNARSQTEVCAYGVRAKDGAPVAAPLEWDEVKTWEPTRWTVRNIFRRLSARKDPWASIDDDARALPSDPSMRAARKGR
ncbi:MAG TPA: non-homologous end-joining DNA ligase [Acidimicrobiales bacterium]|nr:non-homologous end-joining DNA ligase [Acidimicrobiales bacterium]